MRCILLAIRDVRHVPRRALHKVAALARATGATVELFHAVAEPAARLASHASRRRRNHSAEPPAQQAVRLARERLELIGRSALLRGCRLRYAAVWDWPAHEAIVREARAWRADLVVATTYRHARTARIFLQNTDWELIRYCPVPVLLVKSDRVYRKHAVLVAVDPFHSHAKPARLDAQLLRVGARLAQATGGALHIFHAYMPLVPSLQGPLGQPLLWESPQLEDLHDAQVRRELEQLAKSSGVPAARRHLLMGDVTSRLEETVRRIGAGIVVMGAVSRSGLRRLFIGSSAERVLDSLACDALVVKPRGFKCAIPRRRAAMPG